MRTKNVPGAAGGAKNSLSEFEENLFFLAHELNSPLRKISGFADLLAQNAGADPKAKVYSERIRSGVDKMAELISALRRYSFAVAQPAEPAGVDIGGVVKGVLAELGPQIRQAGAVVLNGAAGQAEADPQKLAAILRELVVNALKFRSVKPPRIRISAKKAGKETVISVSDNGIGLAQENEGLLFALFRRLPSPGVTGAGVGLALCRRLAEQCGGRVWFISKPGKGAVFHLAVPARSGKLI